MAESHVISALVEKRSELSGLVAHYRKEIARLSEEVRTLDATIRLFEPDYPTESIKPKRHQKKNAFFKPGEACRVVLDILRESVGPITTNDIAREAMSRKGISGGHEKAVQASILTILHRQKKGGLVKTVGKDAKGNCFWNLAG